MLTAIEIENFKAFGKRTRLELAPITLIFGENSVGKSSALKALSLMQKTWYENLIGPSYLFESNDYGTFDSLLHQGAFSTVNSDEMSFRFDFEEDGHRHSNEQTEPMKFGMEYSFRSGKCSGFDLSVLPSGEATEHAGVGFCFDSEEDSAQESGLHFRNPTSELLWWTQNTRDSILGRLSHSFRTWDTEANDLFNDLFQNKVGALHIGRLRKGRLSKSLLKNDRRNDVGFRVVKQIKTTFAEGEKEHDIIKIDVEAILSTARQFFTEDLCHDGYPRVDRIAEYIGSEVSQFTKDYPGWFLEVQLNEASRRVQSGRRMALESSEGESIVDACTNFSFLYCLKNNLRRVLGHIGDEEKTTGYGRAGRAYLAYILFLTLENYNRSAKDCLDGSSLVHFCHAKVINLLRRHCHVPAQRDSPERAYEMPEANEIVKRFKRLATHGGNSAVEGNLAKQFAILMHSRRYLNALNKELEELKIPYLLQVEGGKFSTGESEKKLGIQTQMIIPYLIDQRTNHALSMKDVGFGLSQVLPLVLSATTCKEQLVTIEQPESQIHPSLQANLGDLLIRSRNIRSNQFIVETHSEHIVHRLRRRMRETHEGRLPSDDLHLRGRDVLLYYFSQSVDGELDVRKIRLLDNGNFADPFPEGFFDIRRREDLGVKT